VRVTIRNLHRSDCTNTPIVRTLPTRDIKIGSLTLPATEAGYFMEILLLYRVLFSSVKVTIYQNLVLRLWLRGAIPPLPHTFVACTETNLLYPITILCTVSNCCWLSCVIYYKQAFTCSFVIYAWFTELLYKPAACLLWV
jgi:hypothetical protein